MHADQKLSTRMFMPAVWLTLAVCVAGMGYGAFARYQYLGQRNQPAADKAVAEAAKGSLCMAARMRNDRISRGMPVTNADLEEFLRDCNEQAIAQQEKASRADAALRQANALK